MAQNCVGFERGREKGDGGREVEKEKRQRKGSERRKGSEGGK